SPGTPPLRPPRAARACPRCYRQLTCMPSVASNCPECSSNTCAKKAYGPTGARPSSVQGVAFPVVSSVAVDTTSRLQLEPRGSGTDCAWEPSTSSTGSKLNGPQNPKGVRVINPDPPSLSDR